MKTKITLQKILLLLFLCIGGGFINEANAQGCAFSDAYDAPYIQGIINLAPASPTGCFFTQEYILFEYNGEAYIRSVAGYNNFDTENGFPCPAPDIADNFYDCDGTYICSYGFTGPPVDPELCNALVAASASGTSIWSVSDEEACIVEDPFALPFIQNIINDNNPCFPYSQIQELTYNNSTYFRVEKIIGPNYSPETCPAPDIMNVGYYDCEGTYICSYGFTNDPLDPALCDALVSLNSPGIVIWENDFEIEPPVGNAPIFQNNPWLSNLVSETNCTNETITVYQSGAFQFFYIETATGANLYFEDGTFYCADASNFSCINAYGFTTVVDTWSCNQTNPSNCTIDDPFTLSFIQDIVSNPNQVCFYYTSISQVTYEDNTYFILANNPTGSLACSLEEGGGILVDCEGNYVCGLLPSDPDFEMCLDILGGEVSSIVIWENTNFPEECTGENSLSLPVIQEAINTEPTYDPSGEICSYVSEIVKFTYNFQFYYKITNTYTGATTCGVGDKFYDCEGNYICGTGDYTPACSGNASELEAASESGVVIWSAPIPPITNCIVEDPYSLEFLQNILNSNGSTEGCFYVLNIVQIEYNGSSYFRINTGYNPVDPAGFPCPAPDISDSIYDCEGNYICGIGFAPTPADPELCNALNGASESGAIIWQSGTTPNPEPNNEIFIEYPWLISNGVINSNDCNGEMVMVYSQGIYDFIFVQSSTGNALYFQDGTFYCADSPGFSCVDAYGFTTVTAEWTCGEVVEPTDPVNDPVFEEYFWLNSIVNEDNCTNETISVYTAGTYEFIYVETNEGATLYFQDGTFYCADAPNFSCIAAYGLSTMVATWTCGGNTTEGVCGVDDPLSLSFIQQAIYPFDACLESAYITQIEYDGSVYFQISPYGAVGNPLCGAAVYGSSIVDCEGNALCYNGSPPNELCEIIVTEGEQIVIWPETSIEPDFGEYSWLSDVINEEDCNANQSVTVYTSGIYSFVYVASADGLGTLYFQDGTFYCADAPNFSCINAYSLTEMDSELLWSCSLGKQEGDLQEERIIEDLAVQTDFRMFPNPSTGNVFIEIEESIESEQFITVFDLNGRAIKEVSIAPDSFNTKIEMDLTELSKGIYLVELKTNISSQVKRLVIE